MRKVILIGIMILFLVGTISAESKTYDSNDRSITIKNTFLGIPTTEIAKITPLTPHNVYVMKGKDRLVAEFEFDIKDDYSKEIFNEMNFYNLKNNAKISRNFTIKYATIEEEKISVGSCSNGNKLENGSYSLDCSAKEVVREKKVWNEIKENPAIGKINIGVFADVNVGDYVEFIPTWFGISMPEYSTWTESLNNKIRLYYKLDETFQSNVSLESVNKTYNGTIVGATQNVTGLISRAIQFSAATDTNLSINVGSDDYFNSQNITINYWFNNTDTAGVLMSAGDTSAVDTRFYQDISAGNIRILAFKAAGGNTGYTSVANDLNQWQMLTIVHNTTTMLIYKNGTFINASYTGGFKTGNATLCFGFDCAHGGTPLGSTFDELGIWNRSLTAAEILALYNNGLGITYESSFAPIVTLNSPANNFETASSITFNCSATTSHYSANVSNISLFINGVLNYTKSFTNKNLSEINATLSFPVGLYNWSCRAYDTLNAYAFSANRTFRINSSTENSQTYNASTWETASETFSINVTFGGSTTPTAYLWWNGTKYSGATSSGTGTIIYSKAIDIPVGKILNIPFGGYFEPAEGFRKAKFIPTATAEVRLPEAYKGRITLTPSKGKPIENIFGGFSIKRVKGNLNPIIDGYLIVFSNV